MPNPTPLAPVTCCGSTARGAQSGASDPKVTSRRENGPKTEGPHRRKSLSPLDYAARDSNPRPAD